MKLEIIGQQKVIVSREAIALFNATWPCSELRTSRAYWFEFDASGDLDAPDMAIDLLCRKAGADLPPWLSPDG